MITSSNGSFFRVTGLCGGNSPVPVNSPHKGQWRGALMFSLICVWINGWVNNREAGDLRRYRAHYDVTVMFLQLFTAWRLIVITLTNVERDLWLRMVSLGPDDLKFPQMRQLLFHFPCLFEVAIRYSIFFVFVYPLRRTKCRHKTFSQYQCFYLITKYKTFCTMTIPADMWLNNNVIIASKRRRDVVST